MKRVTQQKIIGLLVVLLTLLVLLNSTRYFTRLDLTSNKAYSIASVSRNIYSGLEDTLYITYYLSERLRSREPGTEQIVDILYEYAAYGQGKIQVDIIDPLEDNLVDTVEQLGIVPQQIQVIEEDQQSIAIVYTGLAIRYQGRNKVIPVVFDIATIEYQLTSSILSLVRDDERVIGLMTDGDERNDFTKLTLLEQQLNQNFALRNVSAGEPISPDIDALLVFGSENFDYDSIYYINKYIMDGGGAMLAASSGNVVIDPRTSSIVAGEAHTGPFYELVSSYGIDISTSGVLDRSSHTIPVSQRRGAFTVQTFLPYPHWISLQGNFVNKEHPITARFSGLTLFWPNNLLIKGDSPDIVPLMYTTDEAWLMEGSYIVDPQQSDLFSVGNTERDSYVLAASITGRLEGISENPDFPMPEGIEDEAEDIPAFTENARVIVIGDDQFATEMMRFTSSQAANLTFLENVAEWLTNDDDLLEIRTRSQRDTTLNVNQEGFAARKGVAEWLNMLGIPLLVIVYGVFRMIRRKQRAQSNIEGEGTKNG